MAHSVRIFDDHSVMDRVIQNARDLKGSYVKVGYPAGGKLGAPSKKGSSHNPYQDVSELATVAATHEYGAPKKNIPKRATIRPAIDKGKEKIGKLQAKLVDAVFAGKITIEQALDTLGEFLISLIKKEISTLLLPPLSPKTIKKKKSSKPLIDMGQMRNSVTYTQHREN